ncbi:hypothetical protein [Pararhizobium sp. O133]|uniref:hypothetical protein n=1 Tax=Pararhizobium sp. O133 TaxID=3449278 RepID=UPI003F682BBF
MGEGLTGPTGDRPLRGHQTRKRTWARNSADEQAKRRVMPIVRDLIETVLIGKTLGNQAASLQVHGDIANIIRRWM